MFTSAVVVAVLVDAVVARISVVAIAAIVAAVFVHVTLSIEKWLFPSVISRGKHL